MNVKFTTREIFSSLMATYLILQTRRFAVNCDGNKNCALLGYYAEKSSNTLPNFRENLSVKNYHYSLRNNPDVRGSRLPRGGRLKSAGNLRYSVGRKQKFNTGILIQKKSCFRGNQTLILKSSAGSTKQQQQQRCWRRQQHKNNTNTVVRFEMPALANM